MCGVQYNSRSRSTSPIPIWISQHIRHCWRGPWMAAWERTVDLCLHHFTDAPTVYKLSRIHFSLNAFCFGHTTASPSHSTCAHWYTVMMKKTNKTKQKHNPNAVQQGYKQGRIIPRAREILVFQGELGVVGFWHGYLSGAYGPADANATHCLLLQQNPDWFYLSGTTSPE